MANCYISLLNHAYLDIIYNKQTDKLDQKAYLQMVNRIISVNNSRCQVSTTGYNNYHASKMQIKLLCLQIITQSIQKRY